MGDLFEVTRALAVAHAALDIDSCAFVVEARRHAAEVLSHARSRRPAAYEAACEWLTRLDQLRALIPLLDQRLLACPDEGLRH
jgi:hypothetical protein